MALPNHTISWITDSQQAKAGSMVTRPAPWEQADNDGLTVSSDGPPLGETVPHSMRGVGGSEK